MGEIVHICSTISIGLFLPVGFTDGTLVGKGIVGLIVGTTEGILVKGDSPQIQQNWKKLVSENDTNYLE